MIRTLRVIIFYTIISLISIVFFTGICIPFCFIKTSYSTRYKVSEIYSKLFINLLWVIMGIRYHAQGLEKLPERPYLVVSNHQSFWENFFMQVIIPEHSWVIKKELFEIPVFGWGLRMVEPIAVDRSSTASVAQILSEGKKKIDRGLSIVIFPEGTRIKPDRSVTFKPSAARLAIDAEVPIVLIAHNAGIFWPKGMWFKKYGTVSVKIIETITPLQIRNHTVRSLTDYIQEKINTEKQILSKTPAL